MAAVGEEVNGHSECRQ